MKDLITTRTHCDRVIARRDGTYAVRRGYFYRHGMTAERLAAEYAALLPEMRVVSFCDNWNPWPKDSYFEVVMELA